MANLKDIKSRIMSVQNTKKITRAMKMVAAAKVKKAENSVKSGRPFTDELVRMFKKLLGNIGNDTPILKIKSPIDNYPALLKRREVKTEGILVVTSNKGLAGAYNANIIRGVLKAVEENKANGIKTKLYVVGMKGIATLKRKAEDYGFEIAKTYTNIANEVTSQSARVLAEDMAVDFVKGEIDKIEIYTTKFKNMMSYSAEKWEILPITIAAEQDDEKEHHAPDPLMLFEPSEHFILQKIVPMYLTNTVYQALLEAQASELASRMTAMSAASNNAEDMIKILTIDYNKARQAAITQELLEVVSGADALKG